MKFTLMQDFETKFREARELQEAGLFSEAKAEYEKIVFDYPNRLGPLQLLGWVNSQLGFWPESIDSLSKAIELSPNDPHSYYIMGVVMCRFKSWDAGIECFNKTLDLSPKHLDALCDRGSAQLEIKDVESALESYKRSIEIDNKYAAAYFGCGNALSELKRSEEAIECFSAAIFHNPNYYEAYINLGKIYHEEGSFKNALNCFEKAISIDSNNSLAHANQSIQLKYLHRLDESLVSVDVAISLKPDYYDAYWNRALTYLLMGHLKQGFRDYHYRWETMHFQPIKRNFHQPIWLGEESLEGKTVFIFNEQGYGDSIQFCRYATLAKKAGATVIYEVEDALHTLFATLDGVDRLIKVGEQIPKFDYYCPSMSLPIGFGTDIDSVPCSISYLRAEEKKIRNWANKLGVKTRARIGLCWSGSMTHKGDRRRSIPLADLFSYLPAGLDYISIQREIRESDTITLNQLSGIKIFTADLRDFSDTAALTCSLDLVITVDTSVAHLAGALGIETWVLLPHTPDWRWMLSRTDSPWYPTMKLYRQDNDGDWMSVMLRVGEDLATRIL